LAAEVARALGENKPLPKRRARRVSRRLTTPTVVQQEVVTVLRPPEPASIIPPEPPMSAAPSGLAHALLLLQALLSLAAVIWADRVRPEGYAGEHWQQLVATGALAAFLASLAAYTVTALQLQQQQQQLSAALGAATAAAAAAPLDRTQPAPEPLSRQLREPEPEPALRLQDLAGVWVKVSSCRQSRASNCCWRPCARCPSC
jgi:uncharacterized membrane protein YcjF (UPF0283 family)